jgi:magnesium-protoporphyrin O-methyltransferase
MGAPSYHERRAQLEHYFDRTAAETWSRLTSDAPVGRIRATVRAGRDEMRALLLSWLPSDLRGRRLLDAGCGTGALAVELARRGASVVAIDLSPTLVDLARERTRALGELDIDYRSGDMLDESLGRFDHVVAMDSLIHYAGPQIVRMVGALAARAETSVLFTFAPRTRWLALMHGAGQLFPQGNRSPSIEPIAPSELRGWLSADPELRGFRVGDTRRVARGFYISQAMEIRAA